jgi:hypothetical protein
MSKKRFSSGLDDLFSDFHESSVGGAISEISVRTTTTERKAPSIKSFSSDLDALLQDALEESIHKYEARSTEKALNSKSKSKTKSTEQHTESHSGLDALIRQTIDIQALEKEEQSGIKRLTVAVDRSKLEKLKTIARMENAYLKDLLVGLIDEYIEEYKQQKGLNL